MAWTERQIAMLGEMGIYVPPARAQVAARPPAAATITEASVLDIPLSPETPVPPVPPVSPVPPAQVDRSAEPAPSARQSTIESSRPQIAAYAHLGWAELREYVAGCTACGLSQGRTQTVFGVGSEQAHWMVIGEAPGEPEDRLGEPFVDKAGQLLDNMLASIGLGRSTAVDGGESRSPATSVYIANTAKCRPPGDRNPTPEELVTCEPYLARQVDLLKPKIILAMGRFAVQRLLRTDEPVGRLRGRVHRYQDVPLIVTYHPAYLLRNPVDKARAWDDLCLARETYLGAITSS